MSHREHILGAVAALFEAGDLDAAPRFFAADYVVHLTDGEVRGGLALVRAAVGLVRRAVPDVAVEAEFLVETADTVAWQRTLRGTQTGPCKGFPATGLPIVWREMVVTRFSGPHIAEEWVVSDLAERLLLGRKARTPRRGAP